MAASSQPLAVEAAIHVLRSGGNAIDAAVTATAVLSVVEPMSTGLGGDCFALIFLAQEQQLVGLNASGRAPRAVSADILLEQNLSHIPLESPLSVTVPGMLDGLAHCLTRFGTISLQQALAPATFYAEHGFPVTEVIAQQWQRNTAKLGRNAESARVYLPDGRPLQPGELFRNPDLASTLKRISEGGTEVFYHGELGQAIATAIKELGGVLSLDDLVTHTSDWVEPIATSYRGYDIVEMPPNNQGLATLMALNIVEGYPLAETVHNSVESLHYLIEAMKLALSDAQTHIADPAVPINLADLLSKSYAHERRSHINSETAGKTRVPSPSASANTAYVTVVDEQRNVVSMISSLFKMFGSGLTVPGTGLLLQNRGAGFKLDPSHPNHLGPGKRPYHTIMPGMILRNHLPWACFGVVGGLLQAQAHLQVVCNLIDFDMNPQTALDAPRFRVLESGHIALEEGIPDSTQTGLAKLGHDLKPAPAEEGFGGGQIILISNEILYGGSDPRKDGCAIGY